MGGTYHSRYFQCNMYFSPLMVILLTLGSTNGESVARP